MLYAKKYQIKRWPKGIMSSQLLFLKAFTKLRKQFYVNFRFGRLVSILLLRKTVIAVNYSWNLITIGHEIGLPFRKK